MAAVADEPALISRFVWLLDSVSRRTEPGQSMPANDSSRCLAEVRIDESSGAD
jgi:hypothetical protein